MRVWSVHEHGLKEHTTADLPRLLDALGQGVETGKAAQTGEAAETARFVWADVEDWDETAEQVLRDTFHAHPLVLQACRERNFVPMVHAYEGHSFVIVHSPLAGDGGHVHVLELDLLVGERYLVTVHGPRNPAVSRTDATRHTDYVRERIEAGRFAPRSSSELAYGIASAVARGQSAAVRAVAQRLPALEMRVMSSDFREPEVLLEELFLLRHELLISRTMAAQSHDVFGRLSSLDRFVGEELHRHARDLGEQFDRVRSLADGESRFLFGVIELYQTRVTTKMTVAMERLAVIAAVTLPVTALASIFGMNVIVNDRTHWVGLIIVLAVMASISLWLLRWARRQGWW